MKKLLTLLLLIFSLAAHAQEEPTIGLLGTFHFAGSSSDAVALQVDDIKSEKRQKEIIELVDKLAEYQPTKVILEFPYGNNRLDSLYQLYLQGQHELAINESQQVGFRLAKKMGHKHVYAADHRLDLDFNALTTYLQQAGEMHKMQEMMTYLQTVVMKEMQHAYDSLTLSDYFVYLNSERVDALNRELYTRVLAEIGGEDSDVGVKVVSQWWERNFRIMKNIDQIVEPGDRAFVLFGQGHTAILKQLYKDRIDVEYKEIADFL